jgi:hypothetical protein
MLIRVSARLWPLLPHCEGTPPRRMRPSSPLGAIVAHRLAMAEHIEDLKAHRGMTPARVNSGPHRGDLPTLPHVPRQIRLPSNPSTDTEK